jgi:hypothetical protein
MIYDKPKPQALLVAAQSGINSLQAVLNSLLAANLIPATLHRELGRKPLQNRG